MNVPNILTISRLFLAPLFFIAYFVPEWTGRGYALFIWIAAIIYVLIELSDLLDGWIARKYHLVTDLGKVMDPFADVFSRLTYFVCFTVSGIMPAWIFLIILYRELGVTFLRMVMIKKGTAMAASVYGKAKAVLYAVSSILGILYVLGIRVYQGQNWVDLLYPILQGAFILAAAAALFSFLSYAAAVLRGSGK